MQHDNDATDLLRAAQRVRRWERSSDLDARTSAEYVLLRGKSFSLPTADVTLTYLPGKNGNADLYLLEVKEKGDLRVEAEYHASGKEKGPIARCYDEANELAFTPRRSVMPQAKYGS